MKRLMLLVAVCFLFSVASWASCDKEFITDNEDGEIITLSDGSVWESLDPGTSATWLVSDDVLVCNDDVMINIDENGERVDVQRQ